MEHKVDRIQLSQTLLHEPNLHVHQHRFHKTHTPYKNMQTANIHCASKETKPSKD